VGFEPTIPAFERAKTIHALDRAATETGWRYTNDGHLRFSFMTTDFSVVPHTRIDVLIRASMNTRPSAFDTSLPSSGFPLVHKVAPRLAGIHPEISLFFPPPRSITEATIRAVKNKHAA
jgi:hypothetical protein